MRFSIVIPTHNEADDIVDTLEALLRLEYSDYEILIVDDSSDDTPQIIHGYPQVRYLRQTRGRGRAAARNEGILQTSGDVVVILNADVILPPDFLTRLVKHYRNGADYVLVENRVLHTDRLLPRYMEAQHRLHYGPETRVEMNWTEGFSCRREAALHVGLFPEGEYVTLVAGEDGWFGENLQAQGFCKVVDRTLVAAHIAPSRLNEFYRQRVGRGHGSGQIWFVREGVSLAGLTARALQQAAQVCAALLFIFPVLYRGWRFAQHSPYGRRDWLLFSAVYSVESIANAVGILSSVLEIARVSRDRTL